VGAWSWPAKEGKANRAIIEVEMERRTVYIALKKMEGRCWKKKEGGTRLNVKEIPPPTENDDGPNAQRALKQNYASSRPLYQLYNTTRAI